jgi:hypothetical protein
MRRALAKLFTLSAVAALWPLSASAVCDLSTAGAADCQIGDAWYQQMFQQPTGSDQLSFVRLGGPHQTKEGYNTSFRPVQFDEITDLTHTHDLLVADVPIVQYLGASYYQFGLDINQTAANPLLSLDQVKVFGTNSTNNTGYSSTTGFAGATLVYSMDSAGDNWVKLNYSLNSGSGSGDMYMLIPTTVLSQFSNVILYSAFGSNFRNNDGFEEWFTTSAQAPIPEPGTGALLLAGLLGMFGVMRRRIFKS